uniref:B-cell receptor CD22 n=1 Tax=Esox lucius TaxID=8010 RepID=A0A6Q2Z8F9_ESOLU
DMPANVLPSRRHLTAKEGSCITIECTVNGIIKDKKEPLWFWMKNAQWDDEKQKYSGTIIVSSNPEDQTPASDLAPRVKFLGSRNFKLARKGDSCGLLIHNLQKTDSGIYKFRYMGKEKWMTEPGLNLTVEDEPCRVNVNNQPAFKESDHVTIKCSTFGLCGSYPEVTGLSQTIQPSHNEEDNIKITEVSFNASWMDDGRVLSCQPLGTKDKCMVRDIKSPPLSYENQKLNMTRGHPNATYNWYKENSLIEKIEATFKISSIKPEDSGKYHCEAVNKHGTNKSEINVQCKFGLCPKHTDVPRNTYIAWSGGSQVKVGSSFSLTCVAQAYPAPSGYTWYYSSEGQSQWTELSQTGWTRTLSWEKVALENHGCYMCSVTNDIGTGQQSSQSCIDVLCEYNPPQLLTMLLLSSSSIPKDVRALVHPDTVLNENTLLSFICTARSNPRVTTFTWVQTIGGETMLVRQFQNFTVNSTTPSHSGLYSCTAQNSLGTGKSQQVEVKVKYAPKYTEIIHNMTTMWQSEGSIPVALSCHSHSYPPVNDYKWFKLMEDGDIIVGKHQNITVKPETPGTYYCIATNTLGLKETAVLYSLWCSGTVPFHKYHIHLVQLVYSVKIVCVYVCLCVCICRHQGWRNGTTENLVEDPQASSRDDPWPGVPYRPEPHPQTQDPQPNLRTLCRTLQQMDLQSLEILGGNHLVCTFRPLCLSAFCLSLYIQNDKQNDYENITETCAPEPNMKVETDTETETSGDDVEINYSEVKFRANQGQQKICGPHHHHQKACHNSSSSDEEDYKVHYTDVKI